MEQCQPRVWAEFTKLEKFTIAFYWYSKNSEVERGGESYREFEFEEPLHGKYRERSDWIVRMVSEALEAVKRDNLPQWKVPTIAAVLRPVDDQDADGVSDDFEEETTDVDDVGDDSILFQQAAARMVHKIPRPKIRRLKQRHLPSFKVGWNDVPDGKEIGDWLTDSETEGRDADLSVIYMTNNEDW